MNAFWKINHHKSILFWGVTLCLTVISCWNMLHKTWKLLWVYLKRSPVVWACFCIFVYIHVIVCVSLQMLSVYSINVCMCVIPVKTPPAGCTCCIFSMTMWICACYWMCITHLSICTTADAALANSFFPSTPCCEFLTFTRPEGNLEWERSAQVCYVPLLSFLQHFPVPLRSLYVCVCASNS